MTSTLKGVAARLAVLPRAIVEESVARFDVIAKASASRALHGSPVMNMHTRGGRRAVNLGTRWNISGENGAVVTVFINGTPAAPWTWLESGTGPHSIGRGGRYLKSPRYPHPVKGPIHHPGSRGQRVWSRAVAEFAAEFPEIGAVALRTAIDG